MNPNDKPKQITIESDGVTVHFAVVPTAHDESTCDTLIRALPTLWESLESLGIVPMNAVLESA